eukprot:3871882-Amphidinium_carterae.1
MERAVRISALKFCCLMANRLGWVPDVGGWCANDQWFSWDEADLRDWLLVSPQPIWQLRLDGQRHKAALNAALGGVCHEERAHSAFQ